MKYNEIVAARIAALCIEHGLTLGDLAKLCKMNKATLEHIMDGTCKKPRIQTVYKIAEAFHMTALEFLDPPEDTENAETEGN